MLHQPLLLLTLLFHAGLPLIAVDQGPAFPPERRVVFTCLSWDEEIESLYYRTLVKDPKAPVTPSPGSQDTFIISAGNLAIASSYRSEPQAYLGPAVIEFFTAPPERDASPAARLLIPPGQSHLLLLFFPEKNTGANTGAQYRVEILPDNLASLPAGGYLLMNTTGKKLIGSMGKKSFELPGYSTKRLSPPADTIEKLEWIFWNGSRKVKPLYSSLWQHRPAGRTLIIITESIEQRGALAIKAVHDIEDPAELKVEPPSIPK